MVPDNGHRAGEADMLSRSDPDCNDSCSAEQIDTLDFALSHALSVCLSAVMVADRMAIVRYVNPGFVQLTGYAAEDVVGQPVKALESGDGTQDGYLRVINVIDMGAAWSGECRSRKKNGETYWSSRTISPVRNTEGRITHAVCVERDISEWKLLEAKLVQAQRMESLGYLVASITHDFNNLLLAMLGFTALLEARLDPSGEAYQYSIMVEKLANKGVDLTQRLLTSGRKDYAENRPVDLNGAVVEIVRILEPMLAENVTVDVQLQEEIPPIRGDLGQLQQAIMNLCLNAADAMPNGGRLGLSTSSVYMGGESAQNKDSLQPGHYVHLSVTDTGVGISEDHLVKIFDPFFTTKGDERGTGLGLSVVRGIVNEHGGLLRVSSTLGQGSDFMLYLPASGTPQSQEADTLRPKAA